MHVSILYAFSYASSLVLAERSRFFAEARMQMARGATAILRLFELYLFDSHRFRTSNSFLLVRAYVVGEESEEIFEGGR
jgi:hypothetical protein